MKKTISILMAFVILLTSIASFSIVANASFENKKYKDFVYCYDDDDEVHISKYIGNDKNVIVPQQIESKTVKIIDVGAFSDCTAESIVIPEGVEEIQYNAFCDCPNLKNISLPESLKAIGWGAFISCSSLEKLVIPNNVTGLGDGAIANCDNLKEIVIGTGCKSLYYNAITYNPKLEKVVFLSPTTKIYDDFVGSEGDVIETVDSWATIYGYNKSFAKDYADKYGRKFVALESTCDGVNHHYYKGAKISATCTEGGIDEYICTCGSSYTMPTNALGHKYSEYYQNVKQPTCTENGTVARYCERENCESYIDEKEKPNSAKGHYFLDDEKYCLREGCNAINPDYVDPNATTSPVIKTEPTTQPSTAPSPADSSNNKFTTNSTATNNSAKKLKKPKISKLKKKKNTVSIYWDKINTAKGYEISYSTSKKFKKNSTKTIKVKRNKKNATIKKLKKGKKYYIRIRAYKTLNGKKIYSSYSKVKSVKL